MLFQSKPSLIIWLTRNSIVFADRKSQQGLDIPTAVANNLEIIDPAGLSQTIEQFCQAHKVEKQQVIIVLDEEVVFRKTISTSPDEDSRLMVEEFTSKVPLSPEVRQVLSITLKDQLILLGVNKAYYETIVTALSKTENKIIGVVPLMAYGIRDINQLDEKSVDSILTNSGPIKTANFLIKS